MMHVLMIQKDDTKSKQKVEYDDVMNERGVSGDGIPMRRRWGKCGGRMASVDLMWAKVSISGNSISKKKRICSSFLPAKKDKGLGVLGFQRYPGRV